MIDVDDPADWDAVNDLFHAALERTGDARRAFLAEACAGDDALRLQLERLVRAHETGGHSLDRPVATRAFQLLADETVVSPGVLVGRYRLVRELGRGGMGAVYLAERADDEFRQQVAVKLIKRGMDTDAVLRHFRDERQIMAALEHANIGRLLDGGTTADGLPYFVMEYVDGQRLDQDRNDHQLEIDQRLALFEQVCAAVVRASTPDHSPRHQAVEHSGDRRRHPKAPGLRHRQTHHHGGTRRNLRHHAGAAADDAGVCESRTDARAARRRAE